MVFYSIFAVEPESFISYNCTALTDVNNPLYMLGCLLLQCIKTHGSYFIPGFGARNICPHVHDNAVCCLT